MRSVSAFRAILQRFARFNQDRKRQKSGIDPLKVCEKALRLFKVALLHQGCDGRGRLFRILSAGAIAILKIPENSEGDDRDTHGGDDDTEAPRPDGRRRSEPGRITPLQLVGHPAAVAQDIPFESLQFAGRYVSAVIEGARERGQVCFVRLGGDGFPVLLGEPLECRSDTGPA